MAVSPARRSAFEILRRVETESAFASVLLTALDPKMREADRALCHEMVLGVLRRRLWLQRVIEHFGNRHIEKLDVPVRLALEMGLYQLRFLTRIPPPAAVNESVNLVRSSRAKSAAGFVNAVLRRAVREPEYDPIATLDDPIEKLSIETSHPRWLIERWVNAFGLDEAAAFARANNEPAPTAFRLTARTGRDKESAEQILWDLRSGGAEIAQSKFAPDSWRVAGGVRVVRQLVDEGVIYLQDEASQLLAHLLTIEPGLRVLDVTAAPGSKATHIAALAPDAVVVGGDLYPHRAETMRRLATQQGAAIHVLVHDATKTLPFPEESFNRVLLDTPCSGTGTLRRNPEIRYRLKPDDIDELSRQQTQMLANAARALRPAGLLIYSTCSVEPEENETVVDSFLQEHPEFTKCLPDMGELQTSDGFLRTWPQSQGCDGFFIARLQRRP
jgi:16S rRNA (cytosine967-C5)-methyltransferase